MGDFATFDIIQRNHAILQRSLMSTAAATTTNIVTAKTATTTTITTTAAAAANNREYSHLGTSRASSNMLEDTIPLAEDESPMRDFKIGRAFATTSPAPSPSSMLVSRVNQSKNHTKISPFISARIPEKVDESSVDKWMNDLLSKQQESKKSTRHFSDEIYEVEVVPQQQQQQNYSSIVVSPRLSPAPTSSIVSVGVKSKSKYNEYQPVPILIEHPVDAAPDFDVVHIQNAILRHPEILVSRATVNTSAQNNSIQNNIIDDDVDVTVVPADADNDLPKSCFELPRPSLLSSLSSSPASFSLPQDPTGNQVLMDVLFKCQQNATRFIDANFPPQNTSIFRSGKPKSGRLCHLSNQLAFIKWRSPHVPSQPTIQLPLFSDAPNLTVDHMRPGVALDGYLLTALASCATKAEILRHMFDTIAAPVGCYGVRVCFQGSWKTIVIDSRVPFVDGGNTALFAASKETPMDEMWVMLAEKAWAKYHGSYEAIPGGSAADALAFFSGSIPFIIHLDGFDDGNGEDRWERMTTLLNEDAQFRIVTATTPHAETLTGDSHVILAVREHEGKRLVRCKNLFDSKKGNGDTWIEWQDVLKLFGKIEVSLVVPWCREQILGAWVAELSAGGLGQEYFHYNPAFAIEHEHEKVWITIEQVDRRRSGTTLQYEEISLFVFETPVANAVPTRHTAIHKRVMKQRFVGFEFELDAAQGPYCVMLALNTPGSTGCFWLGVHSPSTISVKRLVFDQVLTRQARTAMGG